MPSEPTPTRLILCALVVATVAAGVWCVVNLRSAPPPPPPVSMPGQ